MTKWPTEQAVDMKMHYGQSYNAIHNIITLHKKTYNFRHLPTQAQCTLFHKFQHLGLTMKFNACTQYLWWTPEKSAHVLIPVWGIRTKRRTKQRQLTQIMLRTMRICMNTHTHTHTHTLTHGTQTVCPAGRPPLSWGQRGHVVTTVTFSEVI